MKTEFSNHDTVPLVDESLIVPKRLLDGEVTVLPIRDSSLLLKSKEEILFCDYMVYWLNSIRKSIEENTFAGYQYAIEKRIYP